MPSSNKLKSCGRKRAYWLEAHGELVYRASIPDLQTYDHNRAYDLISKLKTVKPIVRCKILCLSDAIKIKKASTFASQPPRRLYMYRDIQRFYSFEDHPTILVLGCMDPERKVKNYEYFRMDEGTVKEVCDLIARAHAHPMYILVHDENSLVKYHSSQSSLGGDSEHAGNQVELHEETPPKAEAAFSPATSNGDIVDEVDDFLDEVDQVKKQDYAEINNHKIDVIEEVTCQAVNYEPINNHHPDNSPIPAHLRSDSLFRRLCANVNEEELWAVDLKYVNSHPKRGNEITTRGPTYLFVAHHKHPDTSKVNSIDNEKNSSIGHKFENSAEVSFTTTYVE